MGSQIVDQNGIPVRLSCVYWQGMNLLDGTPQNLTSPYIGLLANMAAIAATGFDCVRLDWNNRSLHAGNIAGFLLQMDQAVAAARASNLRVILVDHDNEGQSDLLTGHDCTSQQHNGIWYDLGGASNATDGCGHAGHTTQAMYQSDWAQIAARYAGDNTVIGYELWNEPFTYGRSTWGDGTPHDIHKMFQDVGSAILSHNPGKLIFAECPQNHGPTLLFDGQTISYAPWGDCTGARTKPVVFTVGGLPVTNQVVYDVHCYPSSTSGIASIFGSSAAPGIVTAMNASFGFLVADGIAPVLDGEGGTGFAAGADDHAWAGMIVRYLNGELGAQGGPTFTGNQQGMGFAWMNWSVTFGPANDNLGLLNADGSIDKLQLDVLQPLFFYPKYGVGPCTPSASGALAPAGAAAIVDAGCNQWTIAADTHVTKNAVERADSFDAIALGYTAGTVQFENGRHDWFVVQ